MADDGERFIGRNSWNDAIGVVVDELRDDLVRAHGGSVRLRVTVRGDERRGG